VINNNTSSERSPTELLRFGLGFVGFVLAVTGVILVSAGLAITGGLLLLLIVWSFAGSED
jgi:hypothetical protein